MDFGTIFEIFATVVFVTMIFMMRAPKSAVTVNLKQPPADFEAQVRPLINAGKKIEAIKLIREKTNLGLREAKDLVDAMANGGTANQFLEQYANPRTQLKPEVIQQVDELIANGKNIEALKLVRENCSLGLRESKEVVDHFAATRQFRTLHNMEQDFGVAIPDEDDADAAIRRLINNGKKIEALKLYREKNGCGLKEAKEAIDRLSDEMRSPIHRLDPANKADWDETIRDLLRREKKIEALKLYREQHGCGLKEGKEAIDRLCEEMGC